MKRIFILLSALLSVTAAASDNKVVVLEIEGGIGAATAEYVESGIERAEDTGADLLVIKIDTPGGLLNATRDIIKDILGSNVPIATYVAPDGARAASAGAYIVLASHVAAMTPTTSIGAATPVTMTGDDLTPKPEPVEEPVEQEEEPADAETPDEEAPERSEEIPGTAIERKVLNDAVTFIRGLAERHGRNADWAEEAVVSAATLTAKEALEQNVIEFIATDLDDLLAQVDGHEVEIDSEVIALSTANAEIDEFEPNWRMKLLAVISNPEIVLLLGLIGIYGLIYEGWNPGAIVPGVVGIICLLLAAYALQVLPVNYAGLALIIVGIALMIAEAFAPSFGALGIGGTAAFIFGAIMLFDRDIPGFGISIAFVVALGLVFAALIIWMVGYLLKLRRRGAVSGRGSIIGGIGTAMETFTGEGMIWLEGESWQAHSDVEIRKDQPVLVTSMDGLTLMVEPAPAAVARNAQIQT
ncbi:MAG: nodulation protein NfeD [Woeseiaceae bacterium]|nr:nodulation protein NfeD [Woeseiaceae bacterium]